MKNKTLYEELGGHESVYVVIAKMYEKILNDNKISFFFANADINKLRKMTAGFVSMAFGSSDQYNGKDLHEAHKKLLPKGLNDTHFDAVIKHLKDAMNEIGVDEDLIERGIKIVESTRKDILNK